MRQLQSLTQQVDASDEDSTELFDSRTRQDQRLEIEIKEFLWKLGRIKGGHLVGLLGMTYQKMKRSKPTIYMDANRVSLSVAYRFQ